MQAGTQEIERFAATSGRFGGVVALVVCGAMALVGIAESGSGFPPWLTAVFVSVGVLAWLTMLRPVIVLTKDSLVLRGAVETVEVPLAAIEGVVIRQVTAVTAGDRRFVSSAVGRPWRKLVTTPRRVERERDDHGVSRTGSVDYASFVEESIRTRAKEARERAVVRLGSAEKLALASGVTRSRDLTSISLLATAALLVVLTALV
jgi:hypothetical protein